MQKYASGCRQLENMLPLVQGGAMKRSGTRYVKNCHHIASTAHDSRLIPFEFSTEQAYIIELCHFTMRFFRNFAGGPAAVQDAGSGGLISIAEIESFLGGDSTVRPSGIPITGATQANPVVVTTGGHSYEDNQVIRISEISAGMTQITDLDFRVIESGLVTAGATFALAEPDRIDIEGMTLGATTLINVPTGHGIIMNDEVWITGIQEGPELLNNVRGTVSVSNATDITVTINTASGYDAYITGADRSEGDLYVCVDGTGYTAWSAGGVVYRHGLETAREVYITNTGDADLDDKFWDVVKLDAGRFELVGAGDQGTITGLGEYRATVEIASPYSGVVSASTSVQRIAYAQSADVLYLAHPEVPPHKLTRQADDEWTLEEIEFDWPPWQPLNFDDRAQVYASTDSGKGIDLKVEGQAVDDIGDPATSQPGFPVLIHLDDHGYVNGDRVTFTGITGTTELNDNTYTVQAATEDSFELEATDGSGFGAFLGAGEVAIAVFDSSSVVGTTFRLNEIIGTHHGLWEPRSPNTAYGTVSNNVDDRYYESNVYLLRSSGPALNGTSPPIHEEGTESDGRWTWEYRHSGEGYCLITSKTSGSHVVADVVARLPESMSSGTDTDATPRWSFGAWSPVNKYPRSVTFFEDRLWWAGSTANPQTLWASQSGSYENHRIVGLDESALIFTLNTDQVNTIEWMVAGRQLQLGTTGGEFVVSAASDTEALVPGNVRVVRHSTFGSKEFVEPMQVEQVVLFTQRLGRKLRELVYDDPSQSYLAPDMTVLADHLTVSGIRWLSYQQEPFKVVWAITEGGELLGFTYERDQQVTAWHRHRIGGTFGAYAKTSAVIFGVKYITTVSGDTTAGMSIGDEVSGTGIPVGARVTEITQADLFQIDLFPTASGTGITLNFSPISQVISIATIPVPGENRDQLWLAIRRKINGITANYVEVMEEEWIRGTAVDDAWFVDSGVTKTGSGFTTVDGLDHLEGEVVTYLADRVIGTATVSSGAITVPSSDKAQVGLAYDATLQTMRLNAGGRDGTSQGKISRITDLVLRLDQTGEGLFYGPEDDLVEMDEVALTAEQLFDGDTDPLAWPAGYEPKGSRITLKHTSPTPFTLTAVMPIVDVEDSR